MYTLKKISVDSFNKAFNFIQWEFNDPAPISNNISLEIYRSESPGNGLTGFDLIDTISGTEGSFVDSTVANLYEHNRKWYYNIKLIDDDLAEEYLLLNKAVTAYDSPQDYAARHILFLKELSLERFTQRTYYLIKRRTWGTHCSVCWDDTLYRATNANCPTCYGTGWELGYFNPIRFKCMSNPSPSYNELLPFAKWKPSDAMLTMLNFPDIVEEDIIIDDKGDRWIVIQKRSVEKLGRTIEQKVQIAKLMPDDVAYTLPVMVDKFTGLLTFIDEPELTHTTTYPTYLAPILELSDNGNTNVVVEIGTTLSSSSLSPVWTQNDAGLITAYTLYKNSVMVVSGETGFDFNIPSFKIGQETITYNASISYEEGPIKDDSDNRPYPVGSIEAGTVQSNNVYYKGVRYAFSDINGSITDIRSLAHFIPDPVNNSSITFNDVSGSTVVFSYPATLRDITKATFHSGSFTFNILNKFIKQADVLVNDAAGENPILYKVYKYEPEAPFMNVDITVTI